MIQKPRVTAGTLARASLRSSSMPRLLKPKLAWGEIRATALVPEPRLLTRRHGLGQEGVVDLASADRGRPGHQPADIGLEFGATLDLLGHHAPAQGRAEIDVGAAEPFPEQVGALSERMREALDGVVITAVADHAAFLGRDGDAERLIDDRRL